MNIKPLAVALSVMLTTGAAYAAGKDEAYYKAHPDEARAKYTECQKAITDLVQAGKIEEMMKQADDPECKAADTVVKYLDVK